MKTIHGIPVEQLIKPKIDIEALWNALRLENCSTGLRAQRIVILTKEGLTKAIKHLET